MATDLQTARYEDLTAAETPSMLQGITLLIVNQDLDRAKRVINLSLDLEHLISVVPLDPAMIPQAKLTEIRTFRDQLVALVGFAIPLHVFGELPTDPQPDPPRILSQEQIDVLVQTARSIQAELARVEKLLPPDSHTDRA